MKRAIAHTFLVIAAVALSLCVTIAILWTLGYPPIQVARGFWNGAVGSPSKSFIASLWGESEQPLYWRGFVTLNESCPLLLCGLAVVVAFRCGVWNIGAEGQYLIGALAANFVGMHCGSAPGWVAVPVALIAGAVAGGAWAMIAGALKVWRGVQEVLTTILLNFVAISFVAYCVLGPMRNPLGAADAVTTPVAESARLAVLAPATHFHSGIFIAIAASLLTHFLIFSTTFGLRVRAVGHNPIASRFAGIGISRNVLVTFALSGILAGLAGGVQVCGVKYAMVKGFGSDYGYTAIAVALLARLQPLGVIPAAIFFGALQTGIASLPREPAFGEFPHQMVYVAQGIIILLVLAATKDLFRRGEGRA
jgi:simple sugar transport system permease protein